MPSNRRDSYADGFTMNSSKTKAAMPNSTANCLTASDIGNGIQVRTKYDFSGVVPSVEKKHANVAVDVLLLSVDNDCISGEALPDLTHGSD